MINTLRTHLKTIFESIDSISLVLDYHKVGVDALPCLSFEPNDFSIEAYDSCNNLTRITFDIVIHDDIGNDRTRGEALENVTGCLEELIQKISADETLGGNCTTSIISAGTFGEVVHESGTAYFVNVTLSCELISFIN